MICSSLPVDMEGTAFCDMDHKTRFNSALSRPWHVSSGDWAPDGSTNSLPCSNWEDVLQISGEMMSHARGTPALCVD